MWTFTMPTRVTFGAGVADSLPEHAHAFGKRPLIVTDETLMALPSIRKIVASLKNAPVFSNVQPNPTVENVDSLVALIREEGADMIVAIGGGSPMDCAKAAACLASTDEASVRPFHSEGRKFGAESLPLIALPTTAGTGSEVTPFAVLDDTEKGIKGPIAANALYPMLALVDPELTYSLPLFVSAATGLDALCHAIEGYWSKNHQPICDSLAKEAGRLIFGHFERVCTAPDDTEARTALSYAALLAGMAFQLPKNAMVHACSFPLSKRYHLCHGAACAFTLEFALFLNAPHMGGRMEAFAEYCGFQTIGAMAEGISAFKRMGGLPCTLEEAGIPRDAVAGLVEESFHPLMNNNPKEVAREDLLAMYAALGS